MSTALAVSVLALHALLAAPETRPFSVDDLLAFQRLSDPQVSPDGKRVLYTVRTTDREADRGRTDVWVAATDGRWARPLTRDAASDWNARWMPDGGSAVFLSTRSGSAQVWRIPLDGGEAAPLTELPLDVELLEVFPGGERLLLALQVFPDAETLADTAERLAEREADPASGQLYESLPVRHWDAWEDGRRSHLFVYTLGSDEEPLDLLRGLEVDCPVPPFGGGEDTAIAPDGSAVVFAAKGAARDAMWSTNVDLWRVPADGSAAPERLTADNPAWDGHPVFAPDGGRLAWLAMERPGFEADRRVVHVLDLASGERRALTATWDRSPGSLAWSPDGARLFATAADVGHNALFTIDAATGEVATLLAEGTAASPRPYGERVLFAHDTLARPAEFFTVAADGRGLQQVTAHNDALLDEVRTGEWEQFTFAGWNDETVHGFLLRPVDFEEGREYPVAFLIHGGPQGSFGDHFHYRWNPQVYAGAGYATVFIDFHGSTGYGQAFTDSITGDWGGKPYVDLMKGLDFALAEYPFLDGERVAALGASYGGYMVNWIAGQTDRFQCLVNHDGLFDTRMFHGDTEELWFPEWEFGGTPWEVPRNYARHNPALHVAQWETPMLVIHGARDYRVVETQGLAAFTALQRKGIPSQLLFFPDENHWVLKPANSALWHETVLSWLDRWLHWERVGEGGDEGAQPVPASSGRAGGAEDDS